MSKGTRRRNSRCINICVSLYSFSVIVGVLLQRLVSPFNFTSMSSSRHLITYFLGSFFLSCVCVCVCALLCACLHMCTWVCMCARQVQITEGLWCLPCHFLPEVCCLAQECPGSTSTQLWTHAPTLAFNTQHSDCEHTRLYLPSTPSTGVSRTPTLASNTQPSGCEHTRLHLPSIPSTGVAHTPTLAFVLVPGLWIELLLRAGEMQPSRPMSRLPSLCNVACNDMLLHEK